VRCRAAERHRRAIRTLLLLGLLLLLLARGNAWRGIAIVTIAAFFICCFIMTRITHQVTSTLTLSSWMQARTS
jgi:hypothetical protein